MRNTFVCIIFIFFIMACDSEPSTIGSDFFSGGAIDVSYVDSVTVKLSTIKFDSIITSNAKRMLIGTHTDGNLGIIDATAVMELNTPGPLSFQTSQMSYAYAVLHLDYDGYSYYDTTASLTLHVKRLTESLRPRSTGYFYNTSRFKTASSLLGSFTFLPKPHRDDSVQIILSNDVGLELYDKVINRQKEIQSQSEFIKYFKGIAILPESATYSAILGFSRAIQLRIYYYDRTTIPATLKYISFEAVASSTYNHIQANRTSTKLSSLATGKQRITSSATSNEAYLQGGTGLALRIDMPYLRNLAHLQNFFITGAYLQFYPVRRSFTATTPLPDTLAAYKIDKGNYLTDQNAMTAWLSQDLTLGRDTYYWINVTQFVKDQIAQEELNENALMITLPGTDNQCTADRLSIASPGYGYKTQLKIFYATINDH
jgi:hypothetical protein